LVSEKEKWTEKMKIAKIICLFGIIAMTFILAYAFLFGDFIREGNILLKMPWGIVSLVDLYIGFILFSGWIIYREKSYTRSILWVFLMMTLGFFTASLYTFIALQSSKGNWKMFWLGKRVE
jgi:hypothetical protein